MSSVFDNSTILITGGTGSLGGALTHTILQDHNPKEIRIFSRDELKQHNMRAALSDHLDKIRFILGDVRDVGSLKNACRGVQVVIHAAALKQVPAAEYNPSEFVKTNIGGAENVIEAVVYCQVPTVVALSTDKAAGPINLYGATKLCSDKLFVAANNRLPTDVALSVVRYGNVMGSRGSVIPFFISKKEEGIIPITDKRMTRFNITLDEACRMVLYAAENAKGGEIMVPKIPSYNITDLAEAVAPGIPTKEIGIRPGEKIHEEMITTSDSYHTVDIGKYYAILSPTCKGRYSSYEGRGVKPGFSLSSSNNNMWLDVETLRTLIEANMGQH